MIKKLTIRPYRDTDYDEVVTMYKESKLDNHFERNGAILEYLISCPNIVCTLVAIRNSVEGIVILTRSEKSGLIIGKVIELWATDKKVAKELLKKTARVAQSQGMDIVMAREYPELSRVGLLWFKIPMRVATMTKNISGKLLSLKKVYITFGESW